MSANTTSNVTRQDELAAAELGPVVFKCRDRNRASRSTAQGHGGLRVYTSPAGAGIVAVLSGSVLLEDMPALDGIGLSLSVQKAILLAIVVALVVAYYWWILAPARQSSLTLHERGLRYRNRCYRFDDMQTIQLVTPPDSHQQAALWAYETVTPAVARQRFREAAQTNPKGPSLHLVMRNGSYQDLDRIATICEPGDLLRIIDLLDEHHPDLMGVTR